MDISKEDKYNIIKHYQDAFLQMNDAMTKGDYPAYFRLVDRLENMCTLSLDSEEMKRIREIRMLMRKYTETVGKTSLQKISREGIVRRDENAQVAIKTKTIVPMYIEYPLYRVIERICIDSLKRTVLSTAQGGSKYSDKKDLEAVRQEIEYDLKKYGCEFDVKKQ